MKHLTHKLAAIATVGLLTGTSMDANAATNLTSLTNNIAESSVGLSRMTSLVAYLCGSAFAVAGIFKLKQHVDNPGQTPMKDGMIRLGCGGGLLAVPAIQSAMQGSIAADDLDGTTAMDTQLDWDNSAFTD